MSDISLRKLAQSNDSKYGQYVASLSKLADSTEGPLRIKSKEDVPYIGVRSWPTYFFEKIFCTDIDMEEIEKKTRTEIQAHIAPFLQRAQTNRSPNNSSPRTEDCSAHILHRLFAKAEGKNLKSIMGKMAKLNASATKPDYKAAQTQRKMVRTYDEMLPVPSGLSVGNVSIGKVMANLRLIPESFLPAVPYHFIDIPTITIPLISVPKNLKGENLYHSHYTQLLDQFDSSIHGSVAIELLSGLDGSISVEHSNGAYKAAAAFIKKRESQNKHVSVLLCGKDLISNLDVSADKETSKRPSSHKFDKKPDAVPPKAESPLVDDQPGDEDTSRSESDSD